MENLIILTASLFICHAENTHGQVFSAEHSIANIAQKRAMEACYAQSVSCQPKGCEESRS